MTIQLRIDSIKDNPDGTFEVSYTRGIAPLPAAAEGTSLQFPSRQAFARAMLEAEESLNTSQLLALAAAAWFKADPQMRNLSTARGKSVVIDLSGATQAIVVS